MKNYIKAAAPVTALISLVLLLCLKTLPGGKLWKNYSILYVQETAADSTVINALESSGIEDYICLSGQYLPVKYSENSPEVSMYRINSSAVPYAYALLRNSYFYDKSQSFRLYYVPQKQKNSLNACVNLLTKQKIQCGTDESAAYPWLIPLILFAIAVVFCVFSKNRMVFISGAVFPLIYSLCNPFYPVSVSILLLMLSIFFVSNVWGRKGAVTLLLNQKFVPAALVLCIAGGFSCGVKAGLLMLVCFAGTVSLMVVYRLLSEKASGKHSFKIVFIRKAGKVSVFAGNFNIVMTSIIAAVLIFILAVILSSSVSFGGHFAKLLLPSSVKIADRNLPQLEDYYRFNWNVQTFPYRNLNKEQSEDFVEFPRYYDVGNQLEMQNYTLEYNQEYKDQLYNQIDDLNFNSIEKVMKSEGTGFKGGYASTSSTHINLFGISIIIVCFFILLFIYISAIIKKGNKK